MNTRLYPTDEEIRKWMLCSLKHSAHVEYYLRHLDVGYEDPERPHDLVGPGNKFQTTVMHGFALQFRTVPPLPDFDTYTLPALKLHRQQYHHRMWNEPDSSDRRKHNRNATPDALKLGAIDAICSLREPRSYQGGTHTFEQIAGIIAEKEDIHKWPSLDLMLPRMAALPEPRLDLITSLHDFPNIGVHPNIYLKMQERVAETLQLFRSDLSDEF